MGKNGSNAELKREGSGEGERRLCCDEHSGDSHNTLQRMLEDNGTRAFSS